MQESNKWTKPTRPTGGADRLEEELGFDGGPNIVSSPSADHGVACAFDTTNRSVFVGVTGASWFVRLISATGSMLWSTSGLPSGGAADAVVSGTVVWVVGTSGATGRIIKLDLETGAIQPLQNNLGKELHSIAASPSGDLVVAGMDATGVPAAWRLRASDLAVL